MTEGLALRNLAPTVHPEVLGKTLSPILLPMGLAAPCMAAGAHWCTSVSMNGRMRGHCKAPWGIRGTMKVLE